MFKTAGGEFGIQVARRRTHYMCPLEINSQLHSSQLHQSLYSITIYNNLSIKLKELLLSESDLLILLDNIDALLEGIIDETYVYFECKNTDMISNVLYLEKSFDFINNYEDIITFTIYDYIDERLNKLFKINMTNSIENFSNEIYSIMKNE